MKRVNDYFEVSENAEYVLVSDMMLHITSGVAHVVKPYAVAEARVSGARAEARVSGALAVARASGARAYQHADAMTLASSDGYDLIALPDGIYYAGCRGPFTSAQALAHWDREDDRACLFTLAIGLHEGAT